MRLPGWFRVTLVLVLMAVCVTTVWYVYSMTGLEARQQELLTLLDTSRGRARRQIMEYDRAAEALPQAKAALAELLPQAEAAKAEENAYRDARKQLRNARTELTTALTQVQAANDSLRETLDDVRELMDIIHQVVSN